MSKTTSTIIIILIKGERELANFKDCVDAVVQGLEGYTTKMEQKKTYNNIH